MLHSVFRMLVSNNWNSEDSMVNMLEQFWVKVQDRNKHVYGNIFSRKRQLIYELKKKVQSLLELRLNERFRIREIDLRQALEKVLKHNGLLWF